MKCLTCQKEFKPAKKDVAAAKRIQYCPECRKAHALSLQKPSGTKPRKPRKKKPQPPPPPMFAKAARSAQIASSDSSRQSNLSRAAKSTPVRKQTAVRAGARLLMSQLNPAATQGSRSLAFEVDQVSMPKKSFRYDSTFQVRGEEGADFKIMYLNSPLVIAMIYTKHELQISGARSIVVPGDNDIIYYVFGNKTGFLGELDSRYSFTPKPDWSQYRGLALSGSSVWVGKQLDKNGMYFVARITEAEKLQDFDVLAKADNVACPIDDMISFSGVHEEPTYPFEHIDDNDGNIIDPLRPAESFEEIVNVVFSSIQGAFAYTPFVFGAGALSATNVRTYLSTIFRGNVQNGSTDIDAWKSDIEQKYGNIFFRSSKISPNWEWTEKPKVVFASNSLLVDGVPNPLFSKTTAEFEFSTSAAATFFEDLFIDTLTSAITELLASMEPVVSKISLRWDFAFRVVLTGDNIFKTKSFNSKKVRSSIIPDLVTGMDQLTHLGKNMQLPVVQVQSDSPRLQFTHSTFWELIVEDNSPFTIDIVANKPNSADSINKNEFSKYVNIMKAMPPALEFTDGNLSEFAMSQLQSRGIFSDIAGFLGPIIGTIFPPAMPFIGLGQSLVSTIEGAFG